MGRHDFLGVLEPYMMEEKKGLVDFLRSTVGCFRDLPRGHIINLAQHMQQVQLTSRCVCARARAALVLQWQLCTSSAPISKGSRMPLMRKHSHKAFRQAAAGC